ncbi:MAG: hypothetical protein J5611_03345 [Alphaproteobacteria bacterium]|nr:hypothetical protein [Alphaproteobacteria bacterium]
MIERKTLFYCLGLTAILLSVFILFDRPINMPKKTYRVTETSYGAFLAGQHAIYTNDFDSAAKFAEKISDKDYGTISKTKKLAEFLGGKLPTNTACFNDAKDTAGRMIYDASLAKNQKWDELYNRHKTNKSAVYAPFRIWSAIAKNRKTETLKYIDSAESNPSWKAFVRGQIYAHYDEDTRAAEEFANVKTDFMNIGDYVYIMSFYIGHDMQPKADKLRQEFSSAPGGMFMADFDNIPNWDNFKGPQKSLAFNLLQNVSHTQIMLYSDLSILMLRFAQIIGPDAQFFQDAVHYYIGQFLVNTRGNFSVYFDKIDKASPFYLFAKMKSANSVKEIQNVLKHQPLFIPALNKLVAYYTGQGSKHLALDTINQALKNKRLSDGGRAYLIKRRALVHLLFGDLKAAQKDIHTASKTLDKDGEILALQARIWAAQNREIENAYTYAMSLVKRDPTDVLAWDTVAVVVAVREGNDAALEILEKIGSSAKNCSALFEHLGDAYVKNGQNDKAVEAYRRAINLADDGFSVIPKIKKKLRKIQ